MRGFLLISYLCIFFLATLIYAENPPANLDPSQTYLIKFLTYRSYKEHLPDPPTTAFLDFINKESPLTSKLRRHWLLYLAQKKNWTHFLLNYRPTTDTPLQCYYLKARFDKAPSSLVFQKALSLWLTAKSQPQECDLLFSSLHHTSFIDERLILARLKLALEYKNIKLAHFLAKQLNHNEFDYDNVLNRIEMSPLHIQRINPDAFCDSLTKTCQLNVISHDFLKSIILYALRRLVANHTNIAIDYWKSIPHSLHFTEEEQQAFISHVFMTKARRYDEDSPLWFKLIKPAFYTEAVLDAALRYALKENDWKRIITLSKHEKLSKSICWQYWRAKAYLNLGQQEDAKELLKTLAKNRHYYGFLASHQLNTSFYFNDEPNNHNLRQLGVYKPILDQIWTLYSQKNLAKTNEFINEFISELPKNQQSAFVYWVGSELKWIGKSVLLSERPLLKNQLALRFPLAYQSVVSKEAKKYHLSEALIYAIIRQESGFREDIISLAGALGLMQLMPATALRTAKLAKIVLRHKRYLFMPWVNIEIGSAYLYHLSKQFNHMLLIIAAYNAGPRQVSRWMKDFKKENAQTWIETLSWQETRNYIKNVIAFYVVYQYRLNKKPNLNLFFAPSA